MGVIYKITSPSNRIYVGKTYDLRKRIASHKYSVKAGKNIMLHNSIRKYGWDAHVLEVVEEVSDDLLNEREMYWIKELKSYYKENPLGLNMSIGGEGNRYSWMHDIERRKRESENRKGEKGSFYGRKHTEETKKFISEFMSKRNIAMGIKVSRIGIERGRLATIEPVICYDKNGNFLKEYESLKEASDELNVNYTSISSVCRLKRSHTKQFIFRYKTDNYPLKIDVGTLKERTVSRPLVLMSENFEIIAEYPSALEASEFWGIPKTTINRAAMYNWGKPIRTGHQFIYKDLYNELMQEVA